MGIQYDADEEQRWIEQVFDPVDQMLALLNRASAAELIPEDVGILISRQIDQINDRLDYFLDAKELLYGDYYGDYFEISRGEAAHHLFMMIGEENLDFFFSDDEEEEE